MATLQHHQFFIQNLLNKGAMSDDSRFTNRLIAHALKQARNRLLKIKLDKYDFISDSNYQAICVPLEKQPYYDCSCITDNNSCDILKSVNVLPKDLVAKWGSSIEVYQLNGHSIPYISPITNVYAPYSITNSDKSRKGWFIENGHLCILNNSKLKLVVIRAIWEDPEEAFNYSSCEECNLSMNEQFPIDGELVFPMYQLTLELLGVAMKVPEDDRNDSKAVESIQSIDPNEGRSR